MKKRYYFLVGILILGLIVSYRNQPEQRIPRLLAQKLDNRLSGSELLYFYDTHGGFHGDGSTIAVIRLPANRAADFLESISNRPNWHPLPITPTLSQAFAMSFFDENGIPLDLPTPESGWYYFYDRHSKSTDPADDTDLFSRGSYNYDLAIYDAVEKTVWFFALDT